MDYNTKFEQYVKASYRYYEAYEDTGISDSEFDYLCRDLLEHWEEVTHPDKHLADEAALSAGTGFQMMWKFPEWAKQ